MVEVANLELVMGLRGTTTIEEILRTIEDHAQRVEVLVRQGRRLTLERTRLYNLGVGRLCRVEVQRVRFAVFRRLSEWNRAVRAVLRGGERSKRTVLEDLIQANNLSYCVLYLRF